MNLGRAFGNFVRSINTVHVGRIGLGTALTSAATIIAGPSLQGLADAHTHGFVHYAVSQGIGMAVSGSKATLAPSIFAAWAGMPGPVAAPPAEPDPPPGNVIPLAVKKAA